MEARKRLVATIGRKLPLAPAASEPVWDLRGLAQRLSRPPKLPLGVVDRSQEASESGAFFDRPYPIESRPEQLQVSTRQEPYGERSFHSPWLLNAPSR